MTDHVPTRVVLYTWGPGDRVPAAEFRYSPDEGVSLTIINPNWSRFAKELYEEGIMVPAERTLVMRTAGPDFMRALLQPWNMSYYAFVDESDSA